MDKPKVSYNTDDDDQYGSAEDESDESDFFTKPTRPGKPDLGHGKSHATPTHNHNGVQTPSITPTRRPMVIPAVRGGYDDDAQFVSAALSSLSHRCGLVVAFAVIQLSRFGLAHFLTL
jgi:hypothetical protein